MKALVFAGAGSKITFEVGCLQQACKEFNLDPDVIASVSAGSIISGVVAGAARTPEAFSSRVDLLAGVLGKLRGDVDIWQHRFLWPLTFYHGMSTRKPRGLRRLLNKYVCPGEIRDYGRKLRIGAYSLNRRLYKEFTEEDQVIKAIMASSAFPGVFPPVKMESETTYGKYELFADGGIRNNIPSDFLKEEEFQDLEEIHIFLADNLNVNGKKKEKEWEEVNNIVDALRQTLLGMTSEISENDLEPFRRYKEANPSCKIYVWKPDVSFTKINPMAFNRKIMNALYLRGTYTKPIELA